MKDSILASPMYYDLVNEEEEHLAKKQKCYDEELNNRGGLLYKVKDMEPIDAFNFVKNCNCCLTHQINKPSKLVRWKDHYGDTTPSWGYREITCKCDCRQLCRMLCRGTNLHNLAEQLSAD